MNRKSVIFLALPLLAFLFSCNGPKKLAKKKHTYMESAYQTLKEAVNEAEVTILNDTVKVLFPEHLLFKKNDAEINEETHPLMIRFANALNKYEKTKILINGYTDNTGSNELNTKLSTQRADAAKALLVTDKVVTSRMFTWGLGMANAIGDNNTDAGRRRNRRVEFIVLYNYEPAQ